MSKLALSRMRDLFRKLFEVGRRQTSLPGVPRWVFAGRDLVCCPAAERYVPAKIVRALVHVGDDFGEDRALGLQSGELALELFAMKADLDEKVAHSSLSIAATAGGRDSPSLSSLQRCPLSHVAG